MPAFLRACQRLEHDRVLDIIRQGVKREGSMRAFARKHFFSAAYISDVLLNKRDPSPRLLKIFGLERSIVREVLYRKAAR